VTAGIEGRQSLLALVPHQREQVAAEPARHRLDHAQRDRGGAGGIGRAAAFAQGVEAGLRGERLGRGDGAAAAEHG
jgi:hypothetical protein